MKVAFTLRTGVNCRHGGHQCAEKYNATTFPWKITNCLTDQAKIKRWMGSQGRSVSTVESISDYHQNLAIGFWPQIISRHLPSKKFLINGWKCIESLEVGSGLSATKLRTAKSLKERDSQDICQSNQAIDEHALPMFPSFYPFFK